MQKCYVLIKNKTHQMWKYITPVDFAKNFRKSHVSENSKVYYVQFPQNGLHEQ